MAYRKSFPLERWLVERRAAINVLAQAHADLGEVDDRRGRPLEIGRPLAHSYLLRLVAEFQGFVRDLHDLAADKLVELSHYDVRFQPLLVAAATESRYIDRGNADLRSLRDDFRRLGIGDLGSKLATHDGHWNAGEVRRGDKAYYGDLIELRNALAHGNQDQVDTLRRRGILDTLTWARSRMPGLDRFALALDHTVWDHLRDTFGTEPWQWLSTLSRSAIRSRFRGDSRTMCEGSLSKCGEILRPRFASKSISTTRHLSFSCSHHPSCPPRRTLPTAVMSPAGTNETGDRGINPATTCRS